MSDDAALLEGLEEVIKESRKLRVHLTLLQQQIEFYPLLANPPSSSESPPEPVLNPQIAKSTFPRSKIRKEGDGIFGGLRTVPLNPEPGRLLREIPVLPVQPQSRDDELAGDVDQLEPVTALGVGV